MTQFKLNTVDRLIKGSEYQPTDAESKMEFTFGSPAVKDMVTEWSRLVAWSWLESDDKTSETEKNLKQKFIDIVEKIGAETVQLHYCPQMETDTLLNASAELSNLLKHQDFIDLYKERTGNPLFGFLQEVKVPGSEETVTLADKCVWLMTLDHFSGWVAGTMEVDGQEKFLVVLSYPPRPAMAAEGSPFLTKAKIEEWSAGKGDGGYMPPSPYIPTCGC